jgi:hypothetical protein
VRMGGGWNWLRIVCNGGIFVSGAELHGFIKGVRFFSQLSQYYLVKEDYMKSFSQSVSQSVSQSGT